jgi:hypothetical protein
LREWHHDGPQFKEEILDALEWEQFFDLRDYWGKIKPTKCLEAVGEGTQAGLSVYGSLIVFRNPNQALRDKHSNIDWETWPAAPKDDGPRLLQINVHVICDDAK